jgi:predicted nucleotidyltransferase
LTCSAAGDILRMSHSIVSINYNVPREIGGVLISEEQLNEIVRRVVDAAHPLRIVLFGSTARGEGGPESDVDVLVVMPDGAHRLNTAQAVYRNLAGVKVGVDVVVATETDMTDYKDSPGLIYREALRDGRVLYAA